MPCSEAQVVDVASDGRHKPHAQITQPRVDAEKQAAAAPHERAPRAQRARALAPRGLEEPHDLPRVYPRFEVDWESMRIQWVEPFMKATA